MIVRKLELGPFAANCYIVASETTKEGIVIDPGAMAGEILAEISRLGVSVKTIVLTHGHMDHTGALAELKEATGAEVAIHAADAPYLRGGNPMMRLLGGQVRQLPEPDRLLQDGDILEVGDDVRLRVLHTPGHTPGGISLAADGIVFTGDTLFQFGVGRTDFPGGSHEQLIDSIRHKLLEMPDDTVVCPGHGPDTKIGIERRLNPFL